MSLCVSWLVGQRLRRRPNSPLRQIARVCAISKNKLKTKPDEGSCHFCAVATSRVGRRYSSAKAVFEKID